MPGMAAESGGTGAATVVPEPGKASPGNDFGWFMALAGMPLALAPAAQQPLSILPPGTPGMTAKFGTAATPPPFAADRAAAAGGTNLPSAGTDLPGGSRAAPGLPPVFAGSTDAAAAPPPLVATDMLAGLRAQRLNLALTNPIEAAMQETGDEAAVLDLKSNAASTWSRTVQTVLPAPLPSGSAEQPAFDQAVGQRLMFMIRSGGQDAQLRVHPETLGSIDIRLRLDGEEASLSLASPHASVRDALELAVPRLRELLTEAGVGLTQVNVGAGDPQTAGGSGSGPRSGAATDAAAGAEAADDAEPLVPGRRISAGLVDTFA